MGTSRIQSGNVRRGALDSREQLAGQMVYITKDRNFTKDIAERCGFDSMQHSVARIYGRPDDMVHCDTMQTWYYYNERVAFVFENDKIAKITELKSY
jgi:hypothetical protein